MAGSPSPQRPSRDKAPSAVTRYGLWPSPIDSEQVARQATAYDAVHASGDAVYWLETRPSQDGRAVVVRWTDDAGAADAVPAGVDRGSPGPEGWRRAFLPGGPAPFPLPSGRPAPVPHRRAARSGADQSRAAEVGEPAVRRPAAPFLPRASGVCAWKPSRGGSAL